MDPLNGSVFVDQFGPKGSLGPAATSNDTISVKGQSQHGGGIKAHVQSENLPSL